ncbi:MULTISPECIES: TerC family protein [Auritidibacter]|uniref:TerC family protein n=1 Tax=Auritidibacter TaxID=1160973 RepID=UPI000D73356B|nr:MULTISPECIES: TerC family protein [Auritidibacter]PXA80382.1 transporter [Auritidibacter sp. NML120636]WGH82063.1 TerC family protein [Auritidibacter ignavus]WGH84323.1 TerC family protein [Auritidibacter ignavus]WGH91258.1 TerC family protein [Auritidibacter ignavus]
MEINLVTWLVTVAIILGLLAFDYFAHARKAHTPTIKEAAMWSSIYIGLALLFGLVFFLFGDTSHAVEYYTGFLLEKSLSIDNLFVFMIIMSNFQVPREYQQKVLLFGITFALISRTIFILLGAAVINAWSDVFYVFGLFLILLAGQQLKGELTSADEKSNEAENIMVRTARRIFPVSHDYRQDKLFTKERGKLMITPMLLVMIAIGATDVLFAFDSIPAIYGVTQEPYIVFAATAFSLMGLRQLYFLIDGLLDRLVYLGYGLAAILGFIGIKLVLHALHENSLPFINGGEPVPVQEIPTEMSLVVIIAILLMVVVTSLTSKKGKALIALQNAEKFSFRYSKLDDSTTEQEREKAAAKMDEWTEKARRVEYKYLDELIEHKDQWSSIIRQAHETRLEDVQRSGRSAPVSQQVVNESGSIIDPPDDIEDSHDSAEKEGARSQDSTRR